MTALLFSLCLPCADLNSFDSSFRVKWVAVMSSQVTVLFFSFVLEWCELQSIDSSFLVPCDVLGCSPFG